MLQQSEFSGKTVLVTGAGGGLGRVLVETFQNRGARIVACDRSAEAMSGIEADFLRVFDLLDTRSLASTSQAIIAECGLPEIVVNNAGWTRAETLPGVQPDLIEAEMDLNLTGVMTFSTAFANGMAERGAGSFIFVSSVNALSHFGSPIYSAAKAGIIAYSRAVAVEYGSRGVRANCICPGSIRTDAWDHRIKRDATIPEKLAGLYPLGRIVTTHEVAEAAAFLASERASGITGVALPVDAGLTAGNLSFVREILGA